MGNQGKQNADLADEEQKKNTRAGSRKEDPEFDRKQREEKAPKQKVVPKQGTNE